ncbi:MAG: PAS domain-containing protein [bacterium]|nr:PAS domain-containing protein [bacterium]
MADGSVLRPDLSLVLERITDGFFALDAEWRFAYMNAEARKLLHAREDFLGVFWLDAFPKARGRLFEREYRRAMRDQRPVQFVEYSQTANRWFEVKAYPSPDGLSVYFRDVTARIEAQQEVERTARRQQALIDFGRAALSGGSYESLVTDAMELVRDVLDANVIELYEYVRPSGTFRVRQALGWERGSALDLADAPLEHVRRAIENGEPFVSSDVRIEARARSLAALAKVGILSCVCVPIGSVRDPLGALVAYHPKPRTVSAVDVRFVEALAQTLAESARALESNRRMAQVLESIRDAFVAVDRELRVTYVNARMASFWSESPLDMIGRPLAHFTDQFADDGISHRHFREALEGDRAVTFELNFTERWLEVRLYPFSDGVAAYVRDITRRKTEQQRIVALNLDLERRVAERTKQLELANKELESFSYSVSHDLRAPLRAIDGFSQALVEDYRERLDDQGRNYLERVRKAAQRMADLIDALLGLSKVARAHISMQPLDLSAIAADVAGDLRDGEPEREVEIEIEAGLEAHGESGLIHAVFANLMGNAWKFTRKSPHPLIRVGRLPSGEFFVADNGAGFDMAYSNKLFGAFQRLHAADEYEGTGIGLATVARIVHRHGGAIRADGAPGAGATFYFTLPGSRTEE